MATAFQWDTIALVFIVGGLGTYLLRLSVIALIGRVAALPDSVSATLDLVPPAVLAALAVATLINFSPTPTPVFEFQAGEVVAATVGAIVAWRTRNVLATIVVGMLVLWSIHLLAG